MGWNFFISFLTRMWFLTPVSSQIFLKINSSTPKNYIKYIDIGWLEYWGPQKNYSFLLRLSRWFSRVQRNVINKILILSLVIYIFLVFMIYFCSIIITFVFQARDPFMAKKMIYIFFIFIPIRIFFIILNIFIKSQFFLTTLLYLELIVLRILILFYINFTVFNFFDLYFLFIFLIKSLVIK